MCVVKARPKWDGLFCAPRGGLRNGCGAATESSDAMLGGGSEWKTAFVL